MFQPPHIIAMTIDQNAMSNSIPGHSGTIGSHLVRAIRGVD